MSHEAITIRKSQGAVDASAGKDFSVVAATDIFTSGTHGFVTGDGPFFLTTTDTLPAGLDGTTRYWLRKIDANTFYLYTRERDAHANRKRVDVTDTGTGVHTMHWERWFGVGRFDQKSLDVSGITTATVSVRGSNSPTKPGDDDDGHELASIESDDLINIPEPCMWIRAYVTAFTSGSINAFLFGQKIGHG